MSFVGSVIAVVFGVFWTIIALNITQNAPFPIIGIVFPLFGVIFIIFGIVQAVYHLKNATGKNRFSLFDVTDSSQEGDPADAWLKKDNEAPRAAAHQASAVGAFSYCPYCGTRLTSEFSFCPRCGRQIK